MNPLAFRLKKMRISWMCLLLISLLPGCDDYQRERGPKIIKFTGQAFGKNATGQNVALTNFPVTINFYTQYPLPVIDAAPPITIEVLTDGEGKYVYPIIDGTYKGYSIGDQDIYYGSCTGAISPVEVPSEILPIQSKNENNLSVCMASLFVIQGHRSEGSGQTLHLSYKAKDATGTVIFTPAFEITGSLTTEVRFFPAIAEVEFIIEIKADGELVEAIVETHLSKPGTTTVIDVDF